MFFISTAYADAAVATPVNPIMQFVPFILVFVVMYFFMIRPQNKKTQQHKALIDSLQKGACVVTTGGIFGKLVRIEEDKAILEIADGVEIVIFKNAIATVSDNKVCVLKPKVSKKKSSSAE